MGTAWARGQGFSSTAPNTVWFPRLRTIQARRKTLRKVQQKPLKGIVREWTLVSAAGHSTACHSVRSHWLPWDRVSRACLGPGEAHLQGELLAGRFRAEHGASLSAVGILFSPGEAMMSRAQREDHQQALFPSHSWMGMGTAVLLLPSVRALCDLVSGAEGVTLESSTDFTSAGNNWADIRYFFRPSVLASWTL